MKQLIVMRHAKSSWGDPGQRDLDRPLNKRGRRSAELIAGWLAAQGCRPDQALVSSARRTQETWAGLVAVLGAAPTRYLPEIYHAGPDLILEVVRRNAEPEAQSVLVLGHQPGIGGFARQMLAEPPSDPEFDRYPTAATTVIEVPDWAGLGWGSGRLAGFIVPRVLE